MKDGRTINEEDSDMAEIIMLEVEALDYEHSYKDGIQKIGMGPFALIEGVKGYIVTNDECIHWVKKYGDEPCRFPLYYERGNKFNMLPHAELAVDFDELLTVKVGPIGDIAKWIHYFGIKNRMLQNMNILKKSCKEIEADIEWPEWK